MNKFVVRLVDGFYRRGRYGRGESVQALARASVFHTQAGAERIAELLTGRVCTIEEEPDLFSEAARRSARRGLR
jgi:hypothetical protein